MTQIGSIIKLYITKENSSTRLRQEYLRLNFGGVFDDKFYKKKENREVLLTSIQSYDYANEIQMPIQEADLGENILVDFDIKTLSIGDKLQIGESILEIAMECPICKHLSSVDVSFPKLIKDHRGIFANVIKEGKISQKDSIYKI